MLRAVRRDWASPSFLFGVFFIAFFGVGFLRILVDYPERAQYPALLSLLAAGAYYFGLMIAALFWGRHFTNRPSGLSTSTYRYVAWCFFALGLFAMIIFYVKGGVPIFSNDLLSGRITRQREGSHAILYLGRLMLPAVWLYAAITLSNAQYRKRGLRKLIALVVICASILIGTGNRNDLFYLAAPLYILYIISSPRITRKQALFIGMASIFVPLSLFGYGYFRVAVSLPDRLLFYDELLAAAGVAWLGGVGRFSVYIALQLGVYAENMVAVVNWAKEGEHWGWSVLTTTLLTVLPGRQPTVGELLKEGLGLDFPGGGLNPTLVGELFLAWGAIGIFAGMTLCGLVSGILYNMSKRKGSGWSAMLGYAYWQTAVLLSLLGGLMSQLSRWYYVTVLGTMLLLGWILNDMNDMKRQHGTTRVR